MSITFHLHELLPEHMLQMEKHSLNYMDVIEHQMWAEDRKHADEVMRRTMIAGHKVLREFKIGHNAFRVIDGGFHDL